MLEADLAGTRLPEPKKIRTVLKWVAGAAVLGLGAMTLWLYTADKPRAALEAMYPGEYRTINGLRMRLRDTGPHDKPAVILLHGFGASLETWEPWARALSTNFRVIRLDLPGFGLTGPDATGDYSDARAMKLLIALMDQLQIERASLIGNSLGGRIAWTFAAAHPERTRSLVLISPDGFASPGFAYGKAPHVPMMMKALAYVGPRSLLKGNLAAAYGNPAALQETTLTRYRDMLLAPGVRRAMLARMEQTVLRDPSPILAGIKTPTLLVWGEKDGMIPSSNAADYLRHLPNARLARLPTLGHLPFEEDPVGALPPVRQFLAAATS
jgi:pimeloyl-ACP methyl ester carboxylesterase